MGGASSRPREYTVTVHVYRLVCDDGIPLLNMMDASGFGAFHSGVEIDGREFSFGGGDVVVDQTGVWSQPPKQLPEAFAGASFKESVVVGVATLSPAQLKGILSRLRREWPSSSYSLLRRNCNHFSAAACAALGVGAPPAYINRLANASVRVVNAAGTAMSMLGGLARAAATAIDGAAAAVNRQQQEQRQRQHGVRNNVQANTPM